MIKCFFPSNILKMFNLNKWYNHDLPCDMPTKKLIKKRALIRLEQLYDNKQEEMRRAHITKYKA